jgi:hypothetical protein
MRGVAIVFGVALTLRAQALITNNLVADWQGGVGVTVRTGRVAQWNDQHLLLNNDGLGPHSLAQTNTSFQPYDFTDPHSFRGVMFPWGTGTAVPHPHTTLNIGATLGGMSLTNMTVYVVATGPSNPDQQQTMIWFSGAASGWIKFYTTGTYPANWFPVRMFVGGQQSTIFPPLNRAVYVGSCDGLRTTIRWNNVVQTNASQSSIVLGSGGIVGSNGGSEYYSGIVYRIMIYKSAHTAAQMDAQVAELAALNGVITNFTKQAVCRGDSITAGVDTTLLQSYPFQLWERYPEVKWYNLGIGGLKIGPSGNADTMYVMDPTFVDSLYDPGLEQNWLLFFGGANDINSDGIAGTTCYGRLTNYVAARKSSHPWTVVVSTIHPSVQDSVRKAEYNSCIRTNAGGWDNYADPGYLSPVETRLNNFNNTNYFYSDQLHLINAGQSVLADHLGQVINVPHRTTGFFGP